VPCSSFAKTVRLLPLAASPRSQLSYSRQDYSKRNRFTSLQRSASCSDPLSRPPLVVSSLLRDSASLLVFLRLYLTQTLEPALA
jgi:hypothetical protein